MNKMQFSVTTQLMVWPTLSYPKEMWLWRKSLPTGINSC